MSNFYIDLVVASVLSSDYFLLRQTLASFNVSSASGRNTTIFFSLKLFRLALVPSSSTLSGTAQGWCTP